MTRKVDEKGRRQMRMVLGILVGGLWLSFCVWMFAFSYSDSYFSYSHCSRIPVFAAALVGSAAIPSGAILVWRQFNNVVALIIAQVGVSSLALLPLAATTFLLSRVPGPCHLSGDDAIGAGIDFLLLTGIAALSVAGVAIAGILRSSKIRRSAPG